MNNWLLHTKKYLLDSHFDALKIIVYLDGTLLSQINLEEFWWSYFLKKKSVTLFSWSVDVVKFCSEQLLCKSYLLLFLLLRSDHVIIGGFQVVFYECLYQIICNAICWKKLIDYAIFMCIIKSKRNYEDLMELWRHVEYTSVLMRLLNGNLQIARCVQMNYGLQKIL